MTQPSILPSYRWLPVRYPAKCGGCRQPLVLGELARFSFKAGGIIRIECSTCADRAEQHRRQARARAHGTTSS